MLHLSLHWPLSDWQKLRVSRQGIGWIALTLCILSGSTYNAFAKILTGALSPITLLFMSEFLTGFFVVVSFGLMPVIRGVIRLPKRHFKQLLIVGLASGCIAPLLLFTGLELSTAVNASLFTNTEPVFMILLAIIVLRESFGKRHTLAALLVGAGVLTVALRGFTEGLSFNPGDILLILSGLSFAIGSIIFRKKLSHVEPHLVLFSRATVAVVSFFLISPFIQHPLISEVRGFPLEFLPVLLGFGFISRFLNVFGFYQALDRLAVTTVSLTLNISIITSILFAWWLLGEPLYLYHVIGGLLIILGILLLEIAGVHPTAKHQETHHRTRGPRS